MESNGAVSRVPDEKGVVITGDGRGMGAATAPFGGSHAVRANYLNNGVTAYVAVNSVERGADGP